MGESSRNPLAASFIFREDVSFMSKLRARPMPSSRSDPLAAICRVLIEARSESALIEETCRLLSQAYGLGTLVKVGPPGGAIPEDAIGAAVVASGAPYGDLVVSCPMTRGLADPNLVSSVAGLLGPAIERLRAEQARDSDAQRLAMAQRIAGLGSYDWDIERDVNTWSDELYHIYGAEPGSFNPSYEVFLSFIHPDDRERIKAIHREAYETGRSYQMEERIVRPDGEVRTLLSNGEVVLDASGKPVRMTGICMDVTERRRIEAASRAHSERFRALIESAPDAVLVFDATGGIVHANEQTERLFGYPRDDLRGMNSADLIPRDRRADHIERRTKFLTTGPGATRTIMDVTILRKDGSTAVVDVSMGLIDVEDGPLIASFARDATVRREAEEAKSRLAALGQRRRQALEINDNVVQGLVAALTAMDAGRMDVGSEAVERTLQSARSLMSDLLDDTGPPQPGELVRNAAVRSHMDTGSAGSGPPRAGLSSSRRRVVIADDSEDLRLLLRMVLSRSEEFEVVGEASDGRAAVDAVRETRPDVVLLDLAMPAMDGLQAMPEIRTASPATTIVVLSGFDGSRMRDTAMSSGADAYIEKGSSMSGIAETLLDICDAIRPAAVG